MSSIYPIGTFINGYGRISAIRSSKPRDYLLLNKQGVSTWLDEFAIKELLEANHDQQ